MVSQPRIRIRLTPICWLLFGAKDDRTSFTSQRLSFVEGKARRRIAGRGTVSTEKRPTSPVNQSPILSGLEGNRVKITGRIEMYNGQEIRINAASQLAVE